MSRAPLAVALKLRALTSTDQQALLCRRRGPSWLLKTYVDQDAIVMEIAEGSGCGRKARRLTSLAVLRARLPQAWARAICSSSGPSQGRDRRMAEAGSDHHHPLRLLTWRSRAATGSSRQPARAFEGSNTNLHGSEGRSRRTPPPGAQLSRRSFHASSDRRSRCNVHQQL